MDLESSQHPYPTLLTFVDGVLVDANYDSYVDSESHGITPMMALVYKVKYHKLLTFLYTNDLLFILLINPQ